MKKTYETAFVKIISLNSADVITTSGGIGNNGDNEVDGSGNW